MGNPIRHSKAAPSKPSWIRSAAVLAVLCATASFTGVALAGGEPEAEGAAEAVYTAVTSTYPAATRDAGRPVETSCSGRKAPFRCQWWVIKNRFDRVAVKADDPSSVMARRGEGEAHRRASRVKFAGSAVADWSCTKRNKRNVCTAGGYVVQLKFGA